jgi:prepilin-type N-terminal cleavage/methylation domain-containing protein
MMKFFNHKKITTHLLRKAGFTLVEMLVAVFVFSVVMVLSTGAIFSIVSANKTSQAIKSVMDNLNSALDSMSREIRYGTRYHCGAGTFSDRASCSDTNSETMFAFLNKDGTTQVIYNFNTNNPNDKFIERCTVTVNPSSCTRLTAPEVHITNLHFYVLGATINEGEQPQLLITISGYAQAGSSNSYFNIETMVDQRNLDMCKTSVPAIMHPSGGC